MLGRPEGISGLQLLATNVRGT
ncbi:hypothetical protein LCGC14_2570640, partial [marine sediment metagenome]